MESNALKKCTAEALGTFLLTFIGAGSIITNQVTSFHGYAGDVGLLGIAIAHGVALAIAITAAGHISGGHINPAVTCGFLATKRISPVMAAFYIGAQLLGAIVAAFILSKMYSHDIWEKVALGTPSPGHDFTGRATFFLETILTFFLAYAVFSTAAESRAPKLGGVFVGAVVMIDILVGGPLSGASMNPARSFGPALISGHWDAHWAYWAGPILGAVAAALLYDKFISKTE